MREIKCEMDLLKDRPVLETDLIGSPRRLEALAQLAESLVGTTEMATDD